MCQDNANLPLIVEPLTLLEQKAIATAWLHNARSFGGHPAGCACRACSLSRRILRYEEGQREMSKARSKEDTLPPYAPVGDWQPT